MMNAPTRRRIEADEVPLPPSIAQQEGLLNALLERATSDGLLRIRVGEKWFRLELERPNPNLTATRIARVKAILRATAGAYRGLDREVLLRRVREGREQDSHGRPRK